MIFGAAALGSMSQRRSDSTLELALAAGVNHYDTAASYGESELRMAPFLSDQRKNIFLATKTGERKGPAARAELELSPHRYGAPRGTTVWMGSGCGPTSGTDSSAFMTASGHGTSSPAENSAWNIRCPTRDRTVLLSRGWDERDSLRGEVNGGGLPSCVLDGTGHGAAVVGVPVRRVFAAGGRQRRADHLFELVEGRCHWPWRLSGQPRPQRVVLAGMGAG